MAFSSASDLRLAALAGTSHPPPMALQDIPGGRGGGEDSRVGEQAENWALLRGWGDMGRWGPKGQTQLRLAFVALSQTRPPQS